MTLLASYFKFNVNNKYKEKIYNKIIELEPNNSDSMYNIGIIYHKGLGRNIDIKEATKWLKMSADKGNKRKSFISNNSIKIK